MASNLTSHVNSGPRHIRNEVAQRHGRSRNPPDLAKEAPVMLRVIRQGREYRISVTCPSGPHGPVDLSSFCCDPELARLLNANGLGSTVRARLSQAGDIDGFMAELTDVLEKVNGVPKTLL